MSDIINSFSYDMLQFEHSGYLYLLLFVLAFLGFEFYPGRRFSFSLNKLKKFIDPHLIPYLLQGSENKTKNVVKSIYVLTICLMLILALANPRWNYEEIESYKANINIIFAVDLSKSMDAEDEKPSRIERAKQEINDILDGLSGASVAIVGFADNAHIIAPLTEDKQTLKKFVSGLSTDIVQFQGSNIEAAIEQANFMFQSVKGGINYLVVMSDGDFNTNQNMTNFRLKLKDAVLISYGFGTYEGAPIKQADGGFITHEGAIVISKYGESNMKILSGDTNYIKSSYLDNDVNYFINKVNTKTEMEMSKYQTMQIWQDRFYIPLAIAMIMLMPFFRRGSIFPVIVLFLLLTPEFSRAEPSKAEPSQLDFLKWENIKQSIFGADIFRNDDQKAVNHYEARDYDKAIEKFSSQYNKGVAAFRQKDFDAAENMFAKDVENEFKQVDVDALYNLGTSQLMQLKAKEAVDSYEKLLKIDENHEDAKYNLAIAKQLLQKQKQDEQKNKDKNQNNNDKKDQNKSENSDSGIDGDKGDENKSNTEPDRDNKNGNNDNGAKTEGNQNEQKGDQSGKSSDNKKDNRDFGDDEDFESQQNNSGSNSGKSGMEDGQNSIDLGNNMQQNSGNKSRTELDKEAEKIFNNLRSDTDQFIKNRVRFDDAVKSRESGKEGVSKPW